MIRGRGALSALQFVLSPVRFDAIPISGEMPMAAQLTSPPETTASSVALSVLETMLDQWMLLVTAPLEAADELTRVDELL